ncbi:MAG: 1-pyrroline-5-carboxylate dehydrogenase, partial [Sphingobacteriales bacterium]
MQTGYVAYPIPVNEPVLSYAPGSPERKLVKEVLAELKSSTIDIPMYIGSEEVRTNTKKSLHPPHEIAHTLGFYYEGDASHVKKAIDTALKARASWSALSFENRA